MCWERMGEHHWGRRWAPAAEALSARGGQRKRRRPGVGGSEVMSHTLDVEGHRLGP